MAISTKVGAFSTGTGALNTTVSVSGVGFTPTLVIFWWMAHTGSVDAVSRRDHNRGIGVAVSTSERWAVISMSTDANATGQGGRRHDVDSCVVTVNANGTNTGKFDLSSMDADGFTLIVDDPFPIDMRVGYLAIAGADLTNKAASIFTMNTATGNQDITSLAFQPDFVLFASCGIAADGTIAATESSLMSIGFAKSSSARYVWAGNSDEGSASADTDKYGYSGECVAFIPLAGGNSLDTRVDFVQFLSNGFRVNVLETAGLAHRVLFLALKGGQYAVGNITTLTDTTTDIVASGFGFQPQAAMLVSHCGALSTQDATAVNDELSIGAFSSTTDRHAEGMMDVDGVADMVVSAALEHDNVYLNIDTGTTPAIEGAMNVTSVDAGGFTCRMTDADPSGNIVGYWAIGSNPGGTVVERTVTDAMVFRDVQSKVLERTMRDQMLAPDVRGSGADHAFRDSALLSDAIIRALDRTRNAKDSIFLPDSRISTEEITVQDRILLNAIRKSENEHTLRDSLLLRDSSAIYREFLRVGIDSLLLQDRRISVLDRLITDSILFLDTATRIIERVLLDHLLLYDTVGRDVTLGAGGPVITNITVTDQFMFLDRIVRDASHIFRDSALLSEQTVRGLEKTIRDSVLLSDDRFRAIARQVLDNLLLIDRKQRDISMIQIDRLIFRDLVTIIQEKYLSEGLLLSDLVATAITILGGVEGLIYPVLGAVDPIGLETHSVDPIGVQPPYGAEEYWRNPYISGLADPYGRYRWAEDPIGIELDHAVIPG